MQTSRKVDPHTCPLPRTDDKIHFHNDIKNTPDALDRILTDLEKKGYSFVTVSELIYDGDYKIDSAGKQIKNAAAN